MEAGHFDPLAFFEHPSPVDGLAGHGQVDSESDRISTGVDVKREIEGADFLVRRFTGAGGAGAIGVASAMDEFGGEVLRDAIPSFALAIVHRRTRRGGG